MKVIFVRHGKDDNKYRGGWSKIDLIPEGIEQAKQLANHMKENSQEYHIQRIIAVMEVSQSLCKPSNWCKI